MQIDRNFHDDLARSNTAEYTEFFRRSYKKYFLLFSSMQAEESIARQKQGIDRIVTLTSGVKYQIEEKLDSTKYTNFLFEYETKTAAGIALGWMDKPLLCDYLTIGYELYNRCFILDYPALKRAWEHYRNKWIKYGKDKLNGFRISTKVNESKMGVYETSAVTVPREVLLSAYLLAHTVNPQK